MRKLLLLTPALAGLACLAPTDVCGCPPATGLGTLVGVVTRGPAGAPAPGAVVRAQTAAEPDCAAARYWADGRATRAVADSAGRYRLTFTGVRPADSACVQAVVSAAPGADSAVTAPFRMRLVADYGTRDRPVERRLDLRLP